MKFLNSHLKARLLKQRGCYRTRASWFLGSLCQILFRLGHSGPLRRRIIPLHLRSRDKPFYVRLGSSDCSVLAQIFFDGEYDFLTRARIGDVRTVIDLGANVGFFSRWIGETYPAAAIIGVEPDAGNMTLLRRNIDAAGLTDRYVFYQACVAATTRTVRLNRSKGEWGIRMVEQADPDSPTDSAASDVHTVTMDAILGVLSPNKTVDLLKCDIEGAESELFRDCSSWINRVGTIILEIHPPYSREALLEDLAANGAAFAISETLDVGFGMYVFLLTRSPGQVEGASAG